MQQDLSNQTERDCRSRVYWVFPTYSLREYYKNYAREVDREKLLWIYLGERGKKAWILWVLSRSLISTPWSLHTLTFTRFGRLEVEIAQEGKGRWGREGGAVKLWKRERKLFHRGQRHLYLNNPESPGQVRNIWETRSFRANPGDSALPESSEQIFKEFDFCIDLEDCLCDICEPEQYQQFGLATNKQREQ
jgi:hypothetical protein